MGVVGKEKETWMKLTTKPLDNEKNYRKVKKAFCSLPQIKDQLYDPESNETVTIRVVCCSPEKVADKLCQKGGGAIKKIEYGIDNPLVPKSMGPEQPKEADKPTEAEKPKEEENPKPEQAASSSQTMAYNPGPPLGHHPMYGGGSYDGYNQRYGYYSGRPLGQPMFNGYPSRSIQDSYGGGGWYGSEESSSCTLM